MPVCRSCGEEKQVCEMQANTRLKSGHTTLCMQCNRNKTAIMNVKKTLAEEREEKLLAAYGIDTKTYNSMYSDQNGSCKICGRKCDVLWVDHCHKSKKVRGLLCRWCNSVLGYASDDITVLENAITYLKSFRSHP